MNRTEKEEYIIGFISSVGGSISGIITAFSPAEYADLIPLIESSTAMECWGSIPNSLQAIK